MSGPQARTPDAHARPDDADEELDDDDDSLLDIALALAARGLPVFPCAASKRPAIPEHEGGHGCLDATTDPDKVRALFAKAGARAALVGVATGERSGINVLDVDPRNSGHVWLNDNIDRLPETLIHATPSGGEHHVFIHFPGTRNSAGLIAPGIDVRGDGGYAIWPPSAGYAVIHHAEPAEWPNWLLLILMKAKPAPRPFIQSDPTKITDARLKGLLEALMARLSQAPEGSKHDTLLRIARAVGGYAHLLAMSDDQLVQMMLSALPATVIDWKGAEDTARDGLAYGRNTPLLLEDRPNPNARPQRQADRTLYSNSADEPEPPPDWDDHHPPAHEAPGAQPGPGPRPAPRHGRILTGDTFISSFTPPDWLIDGIVQRGRLYACTSLTGHGKTAVWLYNACMIQAHRMVGNLDVAGGNVVYLAGENPEDLKARMHGMIAAYKLKPAQLPFVLPGNFPLTIEEAEALMREIAALGVPISLILGDTASSFFPGDDENNNVQAGTYARTLRRFTLEVDGNPTVVALSHPVKNASRTNLLPRGGGAFLNELDGNLALWSESLGEVTELHWQAKIRGPDFSPLGFRLRSVPTGFLDRRDRPVMTIVAEPMSEEAAADHTKQTLANEDVVLRSMRDHPDWSWAQIARDAGWVDEDDQAEKWRVGRAINALAADKLIDRRRKNEKWRLTDKGEEVLDGHN